MSMNYSVVSSMLIAEPIGNSLPVGLSALLYSSAVAPSMIIATSTFLVISNMGIYKFAV